MKRFDTTTRRLAAALLVAAGVVAVAAPASLAGGLAAAEQSTDTMSLTSASAGPGETVTVELRTTAGDVAGYQANVTFDPDVVRVESVAGADMDDPVTNVQNESGWVFLTQSSASGSDATVLAEITFAVREDASPGDGSDVGLVEADSMLNDGEANVISVTLQDGRVDVTEAGGLSGDGLLGGDALLYVGGGVGVVTAIGLGVLVGRKFA